MTGAFLLPAPEVTITEELKLDLIRVACHPESVFEYELIYKAGNATGMWPVYSFDEDWYYLYKEDTERYRVKRRKELEGIAPAFTYKQQRKRQDDKPEEQAHTRQQVAAEVQTAFETPEQEFEMRMGGL